METLFVVLFMVFLHVVADYNLQGWLASAKQKSYWEANAPEKMYKHDYIIALIMHSISWSFMIMLPIAYYKPWCVNWVFAVVFACNIIVHAVVDHLKANVKRINLWQDQLIHILQIILTAVLLIEI